MSQFSLRPAPGAESPQMVAPPVGSSSNGDQLL
jgi:hypothetical protein